MLWLGGERVGRAALTATVLGVVARYLQPANFGRLNFALSTVAIAGALGTLGLEGIAVNELVRRPNRAAAVLGTALRLRFLAGVVAAIALWAIVASVPVFRDNAALVMIVSASLLLQPVDVVDLWFQRHLDSRRTVLVRLVAVTLGAVLKLVLVAIGGRLLAFGWAQVAEGAVYALGMAWAYRRSPHRTERWVWDREVAAVFWRRGAPLAIAGVIVALSLRFDQLIVLAWLGEKPAGIYFAASRLTEIALFAGTATTLSLFPSLAASHRESDTAFRQRLQSMFDVLSALGWMVALGCVFVGPLLIHVMYGQAYAAAAPVLAVQGCACVFALSAGARWQFILIAAPTWLNIAAALLSIATQWALCTWLLPLLGPVGAAVAWFGAAAVSGYATTFLFPSLRACAAMQTRGLMVPFAPGRWRAMLTAIAT